MLLYRLNQNILFHLCTAFCKLHQTILFPQHFSAGKKTFNCKYVVNTSRILELSFLPKSLIYIHHWGSTHFWSSWWIILYCIIDTGNHMNYTEYFKQVLTNSHSQLNLFRCNNNPAMIVFLLLFVNIPLSDGWLNVLFLYILSEFTGLIMWNRQNITCDRETLKNNKICSEVWPGFCLTGMKILYDEKLSKFYSTTTAIRIRMLHWYSLYKEIYINGPNTEQIWRDKQLKQLQKLGSG